MNYSIRQMRQTDIPAAMRLKNAEGWNQTVTDWEFYLRHDPELCLVAEVNNEVVGTVMAINYQNQVAWIGMMIVDRRHRKEGISTALLRKTIDLLSECQSIKLDASPAGSHVYERLGFVVELELQRMVTNHLNSDVECPVDEDILRIQEADIDEITKYDARVFGVERKRLMRHLAEDRLALGGKMVGANGIEGMLLARSGTHFYQIGPLFSESEEMAIRLFSHLARDLKTQAVTVDIHTSKQGFRTFLLNQGFETQRPFYRMYLGENRYPGLPEFQYTLASPEVG